MSLSDSLRWVLGEMEESQGIGIVGMDGVLVDEQKKVAEIDLQMLGAEFSGLLKSAEKITESAAAGAVTELIAGAERSLVILHRVSAEYFLILVIRPDGNLGKGRFLLRRAGALLKKEL